MSATTTTTIPAFDMAPGTECAMGGKTQPQQVRLALISVVAMCFTFYSASYLHATPSQGALVPPPTSPAAFVVPAHHDDKHKDKSHHGDKHKDKNKHGDKHNGGGKGHADAHKGADKGKHVGGDKHNSNLRGSKEVAEAEKALKEEADALKQAEEKLRLEGQALAHSDFKGYHKLEHDLIGLTARAHKATDRWRKNRAKLGALGMMAPAAPTPWASFGHGHDVAHEIVERQKLASRAMNADKQEHMLEGRFHRVEQDLAKHAAKLAKAEGSVTARRADEGRYKKLVGDIAAETQAVKAGQGALKSAQKSLKEEDVLLKNEENTLKKEREALAHGDKKAAQELAKRVEKLDKDAKAAEHRAEGFSKTAHERERDGLGAARKTWDPVDGVAWPNLAKEHAKTDAARHKLKEGQEALTKRLYDDEAKQFKLHKEAADLEKRSAAGVVA